METFLVAEILKALGEGDIVKFVAYMAIFCIIWLEVKGMKKQLTIISSTIKESFDKGEQRFVKLETDVKKLDTRLTAIETKKPEDGKNVESIRRTGLAEPLQS